MKTRIWTTIEGELSQEEADRLISKLHKWAEEHGLPPVKFRAEVFEMIETLEL